MHPNAGAKLLVVLSLVLSLAPGARGADEASKIFPYDVHTETLDNGLTVVLVPFASGGLAFYSSLVRTGARDEVEPGRTGFAHFFEHMMFRGTEKVPADKLNEFITEIGAEANATTSDDMTIYTTSIAAEDLERVMEVESDRFQNLSYPQDMFQTEAGAVYGEYRKNRSIPMFPLLEAVLDEAFEAHTYGHMAMGYEEDIRQMPTLYDYSKSFFSHHYRPDNVVLLITGDIEPGRTMDMVRRYYGDWKPGYEAPDVPAEPEQTKERRVDVSFDGRTLPFVLIGYKYAAFDPESRGYVAGHLFGELAFGQTSEIYKKLVIDEQAVETIGFSERPNRDPGLYYILAVVKESEKVDEVIAEIDRVIAAAAETPPDEKRLEDVKSRIKYEFLMSLDTPSNVAGQVDRMLAVGGDFGMIDQYYSTVEEVTAADVVETVRRRFVPEKRTVGVLRGAE